MLYRIDTYYTQYFWFEKDPKSFYIFEAYYFEKFKAILKHKKHSCHKTGRSKIK